MCANAGPAEYNYEETISTLRYANRAKNIKNKPKINEDPKDAMLREYQDEISRLKAQLMGMGGEGGIVILDGKEVDISKIGGGISEDALKEMQEKADKEKDEIRARAERDMEKLLDQQKGTEEEVSSTYNIYIFNSHILNQPNPTQPNPTQPNPTQPNPAPSPPRKA